MDFPVVVRGTVQNPKNYIKLVEFSALCANNGTNRPLMNNSCATKPFKGYPFSGTLYGTTGVQKWFFDTVVGAWCRKFGRFNAIFDILHSPWHWSYLCRYKM